MRKRNLYQPGSKSPFPLSRTKLYAFLECPRCFYVDRRLGVQPPSGPPFNINSAVDHLLKKEFDDYRARGRPHPLMKAAGIEAVPFAHEQLDEWRENFKGLRFHHKSSGFVLTGAIDDLWQDRVSGELIVVDYKATAKDGEVSLDADWQIAYKRQMEFYQWLLRQNGFAVSDTGWFVYCNGDRSRERFNGSLSFSIRLIPYTGSTDWVEPALAGARKCLRGEAPPPPGRNCEQCDYVRDLAAIGLLADDESG
jgi:hypothetical protein